MCTGKHLLLLKNRIHPAKAAAARGQAAAAVSWAG